MRASTLLTMALAIATGPHSYAAGDRGAPVEPAVVIERAEPGQRLHRDGSVCPLAELRDAAGAGCEVSAARLAAIGSFAASGKILCAKCDLQQSETCRAVFRTAAGETLHTLCDGELSDKIRKLTAHGELEVTVHGHTVLSASGESILCLEGFSVGTI